MSSTERSTWARRVLGDLDRIQLWRSFVPPDDLTPEQAYVLQGQVARLREDRGERIIGYKVGCTSRAVQDQLGIREPIFARVFDGGCLPPGATVRRADFDNLAIEGELALRLSRDLPDGPLSDRRCRAAVGSVFPVIELHHHHLPAGVPQAAALIVSGGMHAGFVMADGETDCRNAVPAVDELEVLGDGVLLGRTDSPWTMGDPFSTLRWLSRQASRWAFPLRRGQVILTGSPLRLFPAAAGSSVAVRARPLGEAAVLIR